MPTELADQVHAVLDGCPLTRSQYVGLLGQLYHFSAAAQSHLREVVSRIDDPALARWFARHARQEQGHHQWAEQDLRDLGEELPSAIPATRRLIRHIEEVANGPKPYLVLGISYVAENLSPMLDPAALLPDGVDRAVRYVGRHVLVDREHAAEVNQQVAMLPADRRAEVLEEAGRFERLMLEFFLAAAGMDVG
ncbi:MAG TPA: iron-containing redox enzyme family protein [Tepidisphaeraceae bacterium]|jgi:hypothetical protein|nr:iron-containing redox enzyme family protein [Tepidisphaeraceae bacterium]